MNQITYVSYHILDIWLTYQTIPLARKCQKIDEKGVKISKSLILKQFDTIGAHNAVQFFGCKGGDFIQYALPDPRFVIKEKSAARPRDFTAIYLPDPRDIIGIFLADPRDFAVFIALARVMINQGHTCLRNKRDNQSHLGWPLTCMFNPILHGGGIYAHTPLWKTLKYVLSANGGLLSFWLFLKFICGHFSEKKFRDESRDWWRHYSDKCPKSKIFKIEWILPYSIPLVR